MAQENSQANSAEQELNPSVDFSREDGTSADSGDFFESLDREVNGMILDDDTVGQVEEQVTQQTPVDTSVEVKPDDHQHDWEKRYKDSSSEAQRLKTQLDGVSQYQPLIERLKEDTGMVDAIKNYVENGSQPVDVKQALNLPEDFVFDLDDAVANPGSLSAKALEYTISGVVDRRVNTKLQQDNAIRNEETQKQQQLREAGEFKQRMNISDDEYSTMMDWAGRHKTSLEDIYYLKNRGQRDQKVAKGAKEDMLKQMKSVRDIPTSVSNQNTVKADVKHEDALFEALKTVDEGLEGLFTVE